ncbi:terpenoid synthase [Laetiporus sulphureus 93-53]|uniref:Terpene synthase n=1 Tax=Laetiporus sulphureus 93-53 TaxID=1314785 RepID=A0A165I892_9APHY|nr:terpenoid synthase [Laetiporus sulphureus 93-53]KZT12717.1 terpenoid synthase [Laetiporus sulphureus 93-53]
MDGFRLVPDRKYAFFQHSASELLCAYTYPYASAKELRICFDLVNDAYSTGHVLLNALQNPHWNNDSIWARTCKDLSRRLQEYDMPANHRRLLKHCKHYIAAAALEAKVRERNEALAFERYMAALRRENSAVRFCFGLFGFVLGHDLPDEVFEHPVMMRMHLSAVDMVFYSYNVEQAMGHTTNNIMTILMKAENCDLHTASDLSEEYFRKLMNDFQKDMAQLPSWGPVMDAIVTKFVMAMEYWVVESIHWSFETIRYFGPERDEVKRTRIVRLCRKHPQF